MQSKHEGAYLAEYLDDGVRHDQVKPDVYALYAWIAVKLYNIGGPQDRRRNRQAQEADAGVSLCESPRQGRHLGSVSPDKRRNAGNNEHHDFIFAHAMGSPGMMPRCCSDIFYSVCIIPIDGRSISRNSRFQWRPLENPPRRPLAAMTR